MKRETLVISPINSTSRWKPLFWFSSQRSGGNLAMQVA